MSDAQPLILSLLEKPENHICADCGRKKSEWASTTLGVFICIDCSGVHRSLGTHITLVRSCTLDSWTQKLASHMVQIGNKKANEYWESKLPPNFQRPQAGNLSQISLFIKQKYVQRKWAADGPSPNEILDNIISKPQIPHQIKLRHKIRHQKVHVEEEESSSDPFSSSAPVKRTRKEKKTTHVKVEPKKEQVDTFFDNEAEKTPVKQTKPAAHPKVHHEEPTKNRLSSRLRHKIERRTKDDKTKRAPLHFNEGENANESDSSSDPFL